MAIDPRLIKVTIDLDGDVTTYETLAIGAVGTKHASAIQNVAEIRIANIDKETRDRLLTEGSPFNQLSLPNNTILVEAGRVSSGLSQIYFGNITVVNVSQLPDIWLTMKALTKQVSKGDIITISQGESAKFSTIASQAAGLLDLSLEFDGGDKNIANFNFSGAATKLIGALNEISSGVSAYIDDDKLVVRSRDSENVAQIVDVNLDTGLIGLPEFNDFGVRVTILMNPAIRLGDDINLVSRNYPATTGLYNVYKLNFNLANRDQPFYYVLEASRKTNVQ